MGKQKTLGQTRPNKDISFAWIQVKNLELMKTGNRQVKNQAFVKKIADHFDAKKLGVLIVGPARENGRHPIADGQHRFLGMQEMGWKDEAVPCLISKTAITDADLAEIFLGLQQRLGTRPVDVLLNEIIAQHPEAVAIHKVLQRRGYRVGHATTGTTISAAAALRRIFRSGGETALDGALEILEGAYGRTGEAVAGDLLEGAALLVARHPAIDKARLAKKLKLGKSTQNPDRLRGAAAGAREMHGSTVAKNIAALMVAAFNLGTSTGRLPDWWATMPAAAAERA